VKALYREALNLASWLAKKPRKALDLAQESVNNADLPYEKSESYIYYAIAALRANKLELALEKVAESFELLESARLTRNGDLGLLAWLRSTQIRCQLAVGRTDEALNNLKGCLDNVGLKHYHKSLIRTFAENLEKQSIDQMPTKSKLFEVFGNLDDDSLRLSDQMVLAYMKRWL